VSDDGWSRALMAASGVPVATGAQDDELRALVNEARSDGISRARVMQLAQHRETAVREAVAARPDCPLGMQASLAHDRRASVRIALASSGALAVAISKVLVADREVGVLKALARNPVVPRAVLETLAAHRREEVARLARRALEGGLPAPRQSATRELEEGARAARRSTSDAPSPVGDRAARVLPPRPTVGGLAPRPPRRRMS